jgi:hypothetical protein
MAKNQVVFQLWRDTVYEACQSLLRPREDL